MQRGQRREFNEKGGSTGYTVEKGVASRGMGATMAGDREPVCGAHGGCGDRGASSGRQQAW